MRGAVGSARGATVGRASTRRCGADGARAGVAMREGARPDGVGVSEIQRSRMLGSAAQLLSQDGYGGLSVSRIVSRARVSRRTFYEVFDDREDCFLAVFDDALRRVRGPVLEAYGTAAGGWVERVRAGLVALLALFEEQPRVSSLLVVDALRAGPRVLRRRAEVMGGLGLALEECGVGGARSGETVSALGSSGRLRGEGVVGGVFSVIHTRLSSEREQGSLLDLANPLMSMVVLPYRGLAAARRELERPAPRVSRSARAVPGAAWGDGESPLDPLAGLSMRLTYRTLRVLGAIAQQPGASNRVVGSTAGVGDQGQISKLLARLERLGLVHNTGRGHSHGERNAWWLTPRGEEVERAVRVRSADDGAGDRSAPRQGGGERGGSR
ncbi:MAG TPA: TetR family transcriptional regulator [Solirubrobacteraceae bacterium]|jgi:AcrR family transcriptional regulator|nr:TetR family transcriptional regulator [Solirubrobacteraceae bacterium]